MGLWASLLLCIAAVPGATSAGSCGRRSQMVSSCAESLQFGSATRCSFPTTAVVTVARTGKASHTLMSRQQAASTGAWCRRHYIATATSQTSLHQWANASSHQPGSTCVRRQRASSAAVKLRSAVSPSHSPTKHTQPPLSTCIAPMVDLQTGHTDMCLSSYIDGDLGCPVCL